MTAVHRQEWDEADEDGREVHVSQVVAVTVEQHPSRMEPGELREIRDVLGMSGADLALSLGVRHDQLRKWESGGAPIPYGVAGDLIPIAEARRVAIADLVARLRDR